MNIEMCQFVVRILKIWSEKINTEMFKFAVHCLKIRVEKCASWRIIISAVVWLFELYVLNVRWLTILVWYILFKSDFNKYTELSFFTPFLCPDQNSKSIWIGYVNGWKREKLSVERKIRQLTQAIHHVALIFRYLQSIQLKSEHRKTIFYIFEKRNL